MGQATECFINMPESENSEIISGEYWGGMGTPKGLGTGIRGNVTISALFLKTCTLKAQWTLFQKSVCKLVIYNLAIIFNMELVLCIVFWVPLNQLKPVEPSEGPKYAYLGHGLLNKVIEEKSLPDATRAPHNGIGDPTLTTSSA